MISKSQEKYINSLRSKKHRSVENRYIIEGEKIIDELLLHPDSIFQILASDEWIDNHTKSIAGLERKIFVCDEREMKKISELKNYSSVLAIANIPERKKIKHSSFSFLIDDIQDPGNLGSIIRSAEWFGADSVYVSENSVDIYNSKVVQASMGSLLRMNVVEVDLKELISQNKIPVYAADMQGENIFKIEKQKPAFIIIGNEGRGINPNLESFINFKITIPKKGNAESLNASVAVGIIASCWS